MDVCTIFAGIANAVPPQCHTMQTLLTRPVHFSSRNRLHAYEFLFSLWVEVRHAHHLATGIKDCLHTFITADEGLQIFEANARHIGGEPLLTHTVGMTREAGIGWGLSLSSWRSAALALRANTNFLAVLRVTDGLESEELSRTLRLTKAQHEYLDQHLARGEVILRLGNRHPEPILATYPAPTPGAKDITTAELRAARERAQALLPPAPLTITTTQPAAPASSITQAPDQHGRLRLTPDQERVYRRICTGSLQPVSVIATELGLHYQSMDRIKAFGLKMGLLHATPVAIHAGRSRKAIILTGTDKAYELLGLPKRVSSRGGGVAHDYYAQQLLQIAKSHAEVALNLPDGGKKYADIVFRYDPAVHERLEIFLAKSGSTPSGDQPPLEAGALIALEIEASKDIAKTIAHNAINDLAGGADLVVFAVIDTKGARELLQNATDIGVWERLAIVPILQLLDAIRGEKKA